MKSNNMIFTGIARGLRSYNFSFFYLESDIIM